MLVFSRPIARDVTIKYSDGSSQLQETCLQSLPMTVSTIYNVASPRVHSIAKTTMLKLFADPQRVRRYTDVHDCDVACNGSVQYNVQIKVE